MTALPSPQLICKSSPTSSARRKSIHKLFLRKSSMVPRSIPSSPRPSLCCQIVRRFLSATTSSTPIATSARDSQDASPKSTATMALPNKPFISPSTAPRDNRSVLSSCAAFLSQSSVRQMTMWAKAWQMERSSSFHHKKRSLLRARTPSSATPASMEQPAVYSAPTVVPASVLRCVTQARQPLSKDVVITAANT